MPDPEASSKIPDSGGGGIEVAPGVIAPPGTLHLQYSRGSGPGGQNVNKLNTKADLWVHVESLRGLRETAKHRLRKHAGSRLTQKDEIHLSDESQRSQSANREAVLDRLREMIVRAKIEPKVRRRTKPSRAAQKRRLEQKRRRAMIKSSRRSGSPDD